MAITALCAKLKDSADLRGIRPNKSLQSFPPKLHKILKKNPLLTDL